MIWLSALALGLAGSLHCVGMCGPLALALPIQGSPARQWSGRLLYHLSRATAYALMGAAAGAVGWGLAGAWGWQRGLSIAAGVLMLLLLFVERTGAWRSGPLRNLSNWVQRRMNVLLSGPSAPKTLAAMGFANGFLPCGLVYVALAAAAGTGTPLEGSAYMALFGLGTAPALMVLSAVRSRLRGVAWQRAARWSAAAVALLLVLRGLNLGIPYVSPQMAQTEQAAVPQPHCCHKKP